MKTGTLMLAAAATLLLVACGRAGQEAVPQSLGNLGEVRGALLGTSLDGEELRLGEGSLAGKAVIVNYFNSG